MGGGVGRRRYNNNMKRTLVGRRVFSRAPFFSFYPNAVSFLKPSFRIDDTNG